jgi:chromosomal replication initiator protein
MTDPDRTIWDGVLAHLRSHHPTLCRQWFDQLEPLGVSGGVWRVRAHSPVHSDYLQRECLAAFNEAIQAVTGRLIGVRFSGPDERTTGRPPAAARSASPSGPPAPPLHADGLTINPDFGFENFVPGPGNEMALAASQAVAANIGQEYNPLFIHGGVGLGKTHLLQAICLRIFEARPNSVLYYTSCEAFTTQFMDAVQAGEMSGFRHKFRDVDVLVIDDIHFLAKRERTQEEFFHTFNSLHQSNKQIILSSDAPPKEIPDLEERLVSRFNWGLVVEVEPPTYETRVAIVKKKGALRGFEIPDDVATFIAARIASNIRELEGAITKIQMQGKVDAKPISLELARKALGEESGRTTGGLTVQVITDAVTDFYGVRLSELLSKKRTRSVAIPRQVCMYLARSKTHHSLEEIGLYFGGRDHTTVLHALRAVGKRRAEDAQFDAVVGTLERRLSDPAA